MMSDARPTVQLAWPYQLVKVAPSLAIRSMFVVGWPKSGTSSRVSSRGIDAGRSR